MVTIGASVAPRNKMNIYMETPIPLDAPPSAPISEISVGTIRDIPETKMTDIMIRKNRFELIR